MKMSLLEMTQGILSALDSDEVNSISDTPEASQVALLIKQVYNDVISRANLPEHFDLFELQPSGEPLQPTLMYRPERLQSLLWLKYDKRTEDEDVSNYQIVRYLEPYEFLERCAQHDDGNEDTIVRYDLVRPNDSSIHISSLNNKAPDFYTCWDDDTIVFDSYDSAVDTTLQKNKTMVYGEYEPTFTMSDSFVPDLDSRQFSLLYNEAKALAFAELKQTEHARAEKAAKRGWVTLAHQKNAIPTNYPFFKTLPNYGRKRRG